MPFEAKGDSCGVYGLGYGGRSRSPFSERNGAWTLEPAAPLDGGNPLYAAANPGGMGACDVCPVFPLWTDGGPDRYTAMAGTRVFRPSGVFDSFLFPGSRTCL